MFSPGSLENNYLICLTHDVESSLILWKGGSLKHETVTSCLETLAFFTLQVLMLNSHFLPKSEFFLFLHGHATKTMWVQSDSEWTVHLLKATAGVSQQSSAHVSQVGRHRLQMDFKIIQIRQRGDQIRTRWWAGRTADNLSDRSDQDVVTSRQLGFSVGWGGRAVVNMLQPKKQEKRRDLRLM